MEYETVVQLNLYEYKLLQDPEVVVRKDFNKRIDWKTVFVRTL